MVIPQLGLEDSVLRTAAVRVDAIRRTGARLLPDGESTELDDGRVSREGIFLETIANNLTDEKIEVLPYAFLVLP
eukprot:scaffold870_cov268-Pinguiococcus_pyrenoidosus.AAC.19